MGKGSGRAGALALLLGLVGPAEAAGLTAVRPEVEVVFLLDTTSSMTGLIEGAKKKIWSIASEIAKGRPAPRVKMGLVAYRDRRDAYVTKVFDLSSNLDRIYADLLALKAEGGGDGPEHVLQGLQDAVEKISWSKDPKAFKVVYLVGDAPPHLDYHDTPGLEALLERAVRRGVVVNAVQCGSDSQTTAEWQKVARLGEGKFLAIPQDGGMVAVATPYDEKLAALSGKLEGTALAYGTHRREAMAEMAFSRGVAMGAGSSVAAARAVYKSAAGFSADMDLASAVEEKHVDVKSLKEAELPEELRGLAPAARQEKLDRVLQERKGLKKELETLAAKRAQYIAREAAKSGKTDSFDAKMVEALKEQASKKGIAY